MQNKTLRRLLIQEYGKACWLKGIIQPGNPLTLHHIVPVRDGGKTIFENGALITLERHEMFNVSELYFPDFAEEINYYMSIYHCNYTQIVDDRIDEYIKMMYEFRQEYLPKKLIRRR